MDTLFSHGLSSKDFRSLTLSYISAVIPFFNEEKRIPSFIEQWESYTREDHPIKEWILVDDGSTDATVTKLKELAEAHGNPKELKIVEGRQNLGKACALRNGVSQATGDWILTLDADLSTHFSEIDLWIKNEWLDLEVQDSFHIGCREEGRTLGWVDYDRRRRLMGRTFNFFVKSFTGLNIKDSQCGFKLYPASAANRSFRELIDVSFAHDVEIIHRMCAQGLQLSVHPVHWHDEPGSKVHLLKDSWKMFWAIFSLKSRLKKIQPQSH